MKRLVSLTLSLPLFGALSACSHEKQAAPPPPPPEVKVAEVLVRNVPVWIEAIGETRGNSEIEIRARVEGFIESVDFQEGSAVEKGQLLYTLDPRPYEAAVTQALAAVAESEAQLARTHQDVVRYEPLVAKNAISREEYETAVALEKAAAATVDASTALAERARIDLSFTRVLAPEAGLIGRTEAYAGTLVGRGISTLLTRISRIDPMHVRFSFPERDYLRFARRRAANEAPQEGQAPPFELILADGSVHTAPGKLAFLDRNVDPQTGTIMAEAAFENADGILRPGQFGRVRVNVEERVGAILVPQRCVQESQGVFSVMALGEGDKVEQRLVTPAERVDSMWVITSGLAAGDRVLVEGLQKVRPGMQVKAQQISLEELEKSTDGQPPAAEKTPAQEKQAK